jgi:ubiquinone/menaquinone biosynthesis C-methylase UbiE
MRVSKSALNTRIADEAAQRLSPGAAVLDLGCGPGRLATLLAQRRPDLVVTGVDISPDMVAVTVARATRAGLGDRVRFELGDAAALAAGDGVFDLVVSTMSQHHWQRHDLAVTEIARVLRPGGQAWIYDLWIAPAHPLLAAAREAGFHLEHRALAAGNLPVRTYTRFTLVPSPS